MSSKESSAETAPSSERLKDRILRYAEPGILVTILTAAAYYFGSEKVRSYYAYFGLDHWQLGLPTSSYLQAAFLPLISGLVIIGAGAYASANLPENKQDRTFWGTMESWWAYLGFTVGPYIGRAPSVEAYWFPILMIAAFATCSWGRMSFLDVYWGQKGTKWLLGIFIAFSVFSGTAKSHGKSLAASKLRTPPHIEIASRTGLQIPGNACLLHTSQNHYYLAWKDHDDVVTIVVPREEVVSIASRLKTPK